MQSSPSNDAAKVQLFSFSVGPHSPGARTVCRVIGGGRRRHPGATLTGTYGTPEMGRRGAFWDDPEGLATRAERRF
jgi:hypothetical protein